MTATDLVSCKVHDPHATVALTGKPHPYYHGPVFRKDGRFWILYQNEPVEVVLHRSQLSWIEKRQPPPERHEAEVLAVPPLTPLGYVDTTDGEIEALYCW